jgi:hypothetical protein
MKHFIIKTKQGGFMSVTDMDYFKNRLERQTVLNIIADKKIFKDSGKNIRNGLSGYIDGIVSTNINLVDSENAILKTVSDESGIYIETVFQEKRQRFLSELYNKTKQPC